MNAEKQLRNLADALSNQAFQLTGQVPNDADTTWRLIKWLGQMPVPIQVAASSRTS